VITIASLPTDHRYVIYRWLSSDDFLLHKIVPEATVIDAAVNDRVEEIAARIPEDAACFHFHLNCTVTRRFPQARQALVQHLRTRGIVPINEHLTDISKTAIQRKCAELGLNTTAATQDGDPNEGIIVKTDLNFGGDSEWALSAAERSMLDITAGSEIIWKPNDYRVVPRREVEASWWTDPSLFCEKYIGNRQNRWYRANVFFSRLVLRELVNESQIKKVDKSVTVGQWNVAISDFEGADAVTEYPRSLMRDLIRFIRGFAADFAAIDVMMNDEGEAFIIDVNSTPSRLTRPVPGLADHLRKALSAER
jgi:hypothetical protein